MSKISKQLQDEKQLETDEHLSRSVIRSIEIIGEATKALPESLRLQHQDIPWKEIARMRDNLIHRYFGVRYNIVWQVMQDDIPILERRIPQVLTQVHRHQYLEYKKTIVASQQPSSFSKYSQCDIDKAIAISILQEYNLKYRQTAIAKIKDVLAQSDLVLELEQNDKSQIEIYLDQTIANAVNTV